MPTASSSAPALSSISIIARKPFREAQINAVLPNLSHAFTYIKHVTQYKHD